MNYKLLKQFFFYRQRFSTKIIKLLTKSNQTYKQLLNTWYPTKFEAKKSVVKAKTPLTVVEPSQTQPFFVNPDAKKEKSQKPEASIKQNVTVSQIQKTMNDRLCLVKKTILNEQSKIEKHVMKPSSEKHATKSSSLSEIITSGKPSTPTKQSIADLFTNQLKAPRHSNASNELNVSAVSSNPSTNHNVVSSHQTERSPFYSNQIGKIYPMTHETAAIAFTNAIQNVQMNEASVLKYPSTSSLETHGRLYMKQEMYPKILIKKIASPSLHSNANDDENSNVDENLYLFKKSSSPADTESKQNS